MTVNVIKRIISGGQTGVDRAALDVAIALKILHGGWCPLGRKAEDGRISAEYHLQETPSADYAQRTAWNVRDADGTLILLLGQPEGGTLQTIEIAEKLQKPCLIVDLLIGKKPDDIVDWLRKNNIQVLNIAGPRASKHADIYHLAYDFLYRCYNYAY